MNRIDVLTVAFMCRIWQRVSVADAHQNAAIHAILPCAAWLTFTRSEFDDLWQSVMGSVPCASVTATEERQKLREALVAHLYGLSHGEYDHILGTFPLVFPDNGLGQARRAATLVAYENIQI